jgi:endoglucanase
MIETGGLRRTPTAATRSNHVTRRGAALGLLGLGAVVGLSPLRVARAAARERDSLSAADWRAFAARFIAADGRVIDTGNGGCSHSEGQGYGLLFAEHFDDRATFDSVLRWTRRVLRRPDDALHAWRFRPDAAVPVDDPNNATDGDLLIALALLRAGARWDKPDYTDLGRDIGRDLLGKCVRPAAGLTVLLPGAYGFDNPGRVVVNPSYYVFPALRALAQALPHPAWGALQADGVRLLRLGRFGRWQLPADWLEIKDDTLSPAREWPTRFSWDAVRVPLNLVWGGLAAEPAVAAAAGFWVRATGACRPAWADLADDSVARYPASHGVNAVAALIRVRHSESERPPRVSEAEDYYSAALVLLSGQVARELSRPAG